jgi:cytochrome c553
MALAAPLAGDTELMGSVANPLVPAKAGTQEQKSWIPAVAGMSGWGTAARTIKGALLVASALALISTSSAAQSTTERLAPCLACHGESGTSATPGVPSLGGQPEFFLTVQLLMFRERIRPVEPMTQMLKGATDDHLRALAEAIAKLPPPAPDASPADPERVKRAGALIAEHRCNFCHNADFSGEKNVPRIAGQREDYLIEAMRGYKDNSRRGYDAQMADVVEPLTDADFADLAHFLARVK